MDVTVLGAAATVSISVPLTPLNEAVTLVEPAPTPVARPAEFTVAKAAFADIQLTVAVTFAVV